MLDQLRKHSSSWLVKTILALIVLSFILFFGYSRIAAKIEEGQTFVARIGPKNLARKRFELALESTMERMKENFKGEVPENLIALLRDNVLQQLIGQELLYQFGQSLGLKITDQEMATAIQSDPTFSPNGTFDVRMYEEKFLPYYFRAYGEDFEQVVERELLVSKVQLLLSSFFDPWNKELRHAPPSEDELFTPWLNEFKEQVSVEVFQPSS